MLLELLEWWLWRGVEEVVMLGWWWRIGGVDGVVMLGEAVLLTSMS